MKKRGRRRIKKCVFVGCDNKAVDYCNNCMILVCDKHTKKFNNFYLCTNCVDYLKKQKLLN